MRWASIETEIPPKEEKETALMGPQSVYGREGGKFNKRKDHKNESNAQIFHSCTIIHCMTHCIRYMFSYLKQEYKVKKGLASIKASKRPSGRKKETQTNLSFKEF